MMEREELIKFVSPDEYLKGKDDDDACMSDFDDGDDS